MSKIKNLLSLQFVLDVDGALTQSHSNTTKTIATMDTLSDIEECTHLRFFAQKIGVVSLANSPRIISFSSSRHVVILVVLCSCIVFLCCVLVLVFLCLGSDC